MTNSKILFKELLQRLTINANKAEKESIILTLLAHRLGLKLVDIMSEKLSQPDQQLLESDLARLNKGEPVQYIVGKAWFYRNYFLVNPSVLIPRQDTEQMIDFVVNDAKETTPVIVDVGTGSGCLAISLALAIPNANVSALDVSLEALNISQKNANQLSAKVNFFEKNVLTEGCESNELFDYIISNPPYLDHKYDKSTSLQVKKFEPHLALWPPDGYDEFSFYRALTNWHHALKPNGQLVVEINDAADDRYRQTLFQLFKEANFSKVDIIKNHITQRFQFLHAHK